MWDLIFDVATYGEHAFLPSDDKDMLMAFNEDHLFRDTIKRIGQAFAMGFLAVSKARSQKSAKDQRVVELQKEVERLRVVINHLNNHARVEATRLSDLHEETKRILTEKAQEASSLA